MAAAVLVEFPEFALALLLSVFVLAKAARPDSFSAPAWLAGPAESFVGCLPAAYAAWLNACVVHAGATRPAAYADLCAIKCALCLAASGTAFFLPLAVVPVLAVLLFFVPDAAVAWKARRRRQMIRVALPQALDLMVLCVDAGLGLDATLKRIASERTAVAAALNDELAALSRDILLGMSRERAYHELYRRTGVDELKTLASALNQSQKLGLSIGKILRSQSEFMRMKQSQQAEERAHRLPIYMAFPLWFCIMPALLVIVLAPSLILFFEQVRPAAGLFH